MKEVGEGPLYVVERSIFERLWHWPPLPLLPKSCLKFIPNADDEAVFAYLMGEGPYPTHLDAERLTPPWGAGPPAES